MKEKERAANNRTLMLEPQEIEGLRNRLLTEKNISAETDIVNRTLNGDILKMLEFVPDNFADLIIIDPPYNLSKNFNGRTDFQKNFVNRCSIYFRGILSVANDSYHS